MQIEQDLLPDLTGANPFFRMFPDDNIDSSHLEWEQLDNFLGLQQIRGLNGSPARVQHVGQKRYRAAPGAYGEFSSLDEEQLTNRRRMGTFADTIDIWDLVRQTQNQLLHRRLKRKRKLITDLVINGSFSVLDKEGKVLHADGYTQRLFTAAIPWANLSTATPLADIRAVTLFARFHSVRMDSSSTLWLNKKTGNYLTNNSNQADLGGKRTGGFGTFNSISRINELLTEDNLPNLAVWDGGFLDDNGNGVLDIPDNTCLLEGQRESKAPVGKFLHTRNANNPDGAPGPYMRVIDRMEERVPREIEVHDGFNGGPVIFFPSSLVKMNV
jgi:hypothetical protein